LRALESVAVGFEFDQCTGSAKDAKDAKEALRAKAASAGFRSGPPLVESLFLASLADKEAFLIPEASPDVQA
jgi:hypothetical protein